MTLYKKISLMANNVEVQVNKNGKLPVQKGYNWRQYTYLFAKSILNPYKNVTSKPVGKAPNQKGTKINLNINQTDYMRLAKNLVAFVDKYGYLPNYLGFGEYKIRPVLYCYAFARIVNYLNKARKYPKYCNFNSAIFEKKEEKPLDDVLAYFIEVFGKVSTIDGALEKIDGLGYGFYYDDVLTNKQTIHNLKYGGQKPNCTDVSQMLYHIGKGLGYDVRTVHVMCQSGVGHVRQQFKHKTYTDGEWINRDGASVIDGNGIRSIWCSNGEILAYDPDWFMEGVNR